MSFLFVVKGPLLASDVGETNQHFDTTWKFITIKIPADQHKIENFMQYLLWWFSHIYIQKSQSKY